MDRIDRPALRIYLRDHLAASVAAIRLLQRLCAAHGQTPLGIELTALTRDVCAEQEILRTLIRAVGGQETGLAVALAWLGEKVARVKLGPGKPRDSGLMLFETLEALTLAFYGRRSLWVTLARLDDIESLQSGIDFPALADRAGRHLEALERVRMEASERALRVDPDPALLAPDEKPHHTQLAQH